uniref:Resistance to inhibitors of cholinesterase protein 3 N-terminal domain-containing protein n=1 Tax=Salarias fasciatus TaxID=181472 RepID=A0A672IMA2_SALFA
MAMSTFQKVTLATCLVLCVALLLPKMLLSRGRKDAAERPEGASAAAAGSGYSRAHNPEAIARAKGAGTGAGTGGKSNLAGQIIPVYGFGILLYILYILFKITSKGSSKPSEGRFPSARSENMKRKITDFQLAQLQEKLMETELVMEDIVSNAMKGVTADQEENLLLQLTEITRVMQEGQLVEGMAAEKKQQDSWEGARERRFLILSQFSMFLIDFFNEVSLSLQLISALLNLPQMILRSLVRTGSAPAAAVSTASSITLSRARPTGQQPRREASQPGENRRRRSVRGSPRKWRRRLI